MKRLICAKEVEACAQQGHKVMYIDADTLITPSAKDAAAVADIEFKVGEPQANAAARSRVKQHRHRMRTHALRRQQAESTAS